MTTMLIVLYSAFLDDTVRARTAELGVTRWISKCDLEDLPSLVRGLTAV